jgi:hypothetical protein
MAPAPSPLRLCHNQTDEGRGSRVPKLWNAGLLGIVDRRWMEIECFHMLGGPESKRLKDAAPNLFHPTASPPFPKGRIFHVTTQSLLRAREGWGG